MLWANAVARTVSPAFSALIISFARRSSPLGERVACLLCFDYLLRETFQPAWGIRKAQAQRCCRAGRQLRRRGFVSIQGPRRERRKRDSNRKNSTEKL